jgi:hypothetical protein
VARQGGREQQPAAGAQANAVALGRLDLQEAGRGGFEDVLVLQRHTLGDLEARGLPDERGLAFQDADQRALRLGRVW